jgi:hypothetical protein
MEKIIVIEITAKSYTQTVVRKVFYNFTYTTLTIWKMKIEISWKVILISTGNITFDIRMYNFIISMIISYLSIHASVIFIT